MSQYAYIPLSQADALPNPDSYMVRIAAYVPGYPPDIIDSNGNGIPNIYELEVVAFTEAQKTDILALNGQWFADAAAYLAWKQSLMSE